MKKLALTALLAAAATTAGFYANAQPAGGPGQGRGPDAGPRMERLERADFEALTDARIAGIKAGLKLTEQQQPLWAPVEQALRTMAAERVTRMEERRTRMQERRGQAQQGQATPMERPDFMQRLERRSERSTQQAERLTTLSSAMKPLWASLDERQKKLLPILMRPAGGKGGHHMAGHHHGQRMGMMGGGMMGHHGMRGHHGMMGGDGPRDGRGPQGEGAPRPQ